MEMPRDISLRPPSTARNGTAVLQRDPVRLRLLGAFELEIGDGLAHLPDNARRLLAFLALERRTMQRTYVAGRLWPDLTEQHAHGCLRTSLWRTGRATGITVVEATSTSLGLAREVNVDARELEAACEAVFHERGPPSPETLVVLARPGDLLADWYEDWVEHERERLRLMRLLALEAAAERLLRERRVWEASQAALAALSSDPLRESAHRLLIRAALAEGNAAEALRRFTGLRVELHRELGLEPSEQTQALVRGLVA
jgi:DNA-binding SARP family transcriptional activator